MDAGVSIFLLPLREKVDTRNAWTDEGYAGTKAPSSGASRATFPLEGGKE